MADAFYGLLLYAVGVFGFGYDFYFYSSPGDYENPILTQIAIWLWPLTLVLFFITSLWDIAKFIFNMFRFIFTVGD